jgi:hypothetical protein
MRAATASPSYCGYDTAGIGLRAEEGGFGAAPQQSGW